MNPLIQMQHPVPRQHSAVLLCSRMLAALVLLASTTVLAHPAKRPNVLLILADDLGFSDLGSYGSEIATPHLDALARQGVRFGNFHVSASCSPTRAMLLTGVDNHLNGVGNMRESIPQRHVGKPGYLTVLDPRTTTVASRLKAAGYRTYVSGKWHVGTEPHNLPPQRGFDRSLVQGGSGSDHWDPMQRYLDLSDTIDWFEDGQRVQMPRQYYSSTFFVDRLLADLRADRAGKPQRPPFFAYLAFQAPHMPLQAPKAFVDRYSGRYAQGWDVLRQQRFERAREQGVIARQAPLQRQPYTPDWSRLSASERRHAERNMEVYAGMIEALDHEVGRMLQGLRELGDLSNTVVIFLSDNGAEASDPYATLAGRLWLGWQYRRDTEALGGPGQYGVLGPGWASAANAPLSGHKFYVSEGGVRVPMLMAGVPGVQAGSIQPHFAQVTDLVPTVLALAGLPIPQESAPQQALRGRNLLPVIRGETPRAYGPDEPVGQELSGNQALYRGEHKLVRNLPPVGDGRWRLYHLMNDPGETQDLSAAEPERARQMAEDFANYQRSHGVLPIPDDYNPIRQVQINAFINVYVPRFRVPVLIGLGLLLVWGLWRWRQGRRLRTPM
ncbi:MAG: Arylsulfatase [Pseudomonadota bacterium]